MQLRMINSFGKIVFYFFIFVAIASCKNQQNISVAKSYDEPLDPNPSKNEDWSMIAQGLQASITTTDIRFVRSQIPKIKPQN